MFISPVARQAYPNRKSLSRANTEVWLPLPSYDGPKRLFRAQCSYGLLKVSAMLGFGLTALGVVSVLAFLLHSAAA
jgi:hypothetical protein